MSLEERKKMVDQQLIARGIKDKRVIVAFYKVPRDKFIASNLQFMSYSDSPVSIGYGQTISQPYTVAFMTALLELKGEEKVLEIGTGSGYQAAILSKLAKKVYTMESIPKLASKAKALFKTLEYKNIEVIKGDGTKGYPLKAPYDGIIVTAAAPDIPPPLLSQLAIGGCMVIPVGDRFSQNMVQVKREESGFKKQTFGGFRFVPLAGRHGFK